jgi:hypothetical protein
LGLHRLSLSGTEKTIQKAQQPPDCHPLGFSHSSNASKIFICFIVIIFIPETNSTPNKGPNIRSCTTKLTKAKESDDEAVGSAVY